MLKRERKEKSVLINFKLTEKERRQLLARARKYAGGNVSLWLRYAALNHVPAEVDL